MTGHGKTDHPARARVLMSRWRNLLFDTGYYAKRYALAVLVWAGVIFWGI
jgi:hypothetical protein